MYDKDLVLSYLELLSRRKFSKILPYTTTMITISAQRFSFHLKGEHSQTSTMDITKLNRVCTENIQKVFCSSYMRS